MTKTSRIEVVDLSDDAPLEVHIAAEPDVLGSVGRQRCARCGFELVAIVGNIMRVNSRYIGLDDDTNEVALRMWRPGARVVVDGSTAIAADDWDGDAPPNCREAAKA